MLNTAHLSHSSAKLLISPDAFRNPHVGRHIKTNASIQYVIHTTQLSKKRYLNRPNRLPILPRSSSSSLTPSSTSTSGDVQLLWYKKDLRLDDHPGLHSALQSPSSSFSNTLVPVFCFDPIRYHPIIDSPSAAKALSSALRSLRHSLQARGSDLLILQGPWEQQIPKLAQSVGASTIITEGEVETSWCNGIAAVQQALSLGDATTTLHTWTAPLFSRNDSIKDDYVVWKVERGHANIPLNAPTSLPPTISYNDTNTKSTLSAVDIMNAVSEATSTVSTLPRHYYTYDLGDTDNNKRKKENSSSSEEEEEVGSSIVMSQEILRDRRVPSSAYLGEPSLAGDIASSEKESMVALQAYLRHLETEGDTTELDAEEREYVKKWKKKLGAAIPMYDAPATPDGCFPAIFNRSLSLGVVSRRRIYTEAKTLLHQLGESEMPPPPGLLARLSWLLTSHGGAASRSRKQKKAQAAALAAEAGDFHVEMAGKREGKVVHGGAVLGHWRWRGILSDYLYSTTTTDNINNNAPAVLLVHGFGAFSEHYRSNVQYLASKGYAVYAPTLPGYGRSEKPTVAYGQDLWRDYLADFVKNVVKKPVVVVGNSIGGFMSASLAADYPGLASGVVLLNSAGQLTKNYSPPPPFPNKSKEPPQAIVGPVSSALFKFLEGGVEKQLKRVYPVNPDRADAWLAGEISRAAKDPGALGVFRSVFYLPKPRALNYLLDEFGGPVMVLQGALDPLNDAKGRAAKLGELTKAKVVLLNAGHCPHDEVPEEVNVELEKFLKGIL